MGQVNIFQHPNFATTPYYATTPWIIERYIFSPQNPGEFKGWNPWPPSDTKWSYPPYWLEGKCVYFMRYSSDKGSRVRQIVDLTGISTLTFRWSNQSSTRQTQVFCSINDTQVWASGWDYFASTADNPVTVNLTIPVNLRVPNASVAWYIPYGGGNGWGSVWNVEALRTVADLALSGFTLSHRKNHGPAELTLTGSGFSTGMTVKLKRAGYPDLLCTVTQVSGGTAVCTADLFGLKPGDWKAMVTLDGTSIESASSAEIEESHIYPIMALKRAKGTDNTPTDMKYKIRDATIVVKNLK